MVINSLITELKLTKLLATVPEHYHTPFEKVQFLFKYGPENLHKPTAILSLCSFIILMTLRFLKKKLMKRYKSVIFFPEILLIVISSLIISVNFNLKKDFDISMLGDFSTSGFDKLNNPLGKDNRSLCHELLSVGLMCAILGFFESTTASKSLGTIYDLTISSNRELVALGSMNLVGSLFGALPSFGGYGRSKINALSGAQTVMSGAVSYTHLDVYKRQILYCIIYENHATFLLL